jgi:MoaA/NifB/PqqE/SkfB family radical SAM enzyme
VVKLIGSGPSAIKPTKRALGDEPKCVDILLNYACNAHCLFCSQDPSGRKTSNDLPLEKALQQMYLAYGSGYRRLGLTGGEPTLRRDLPKLIALSRKIGYSYVRIQTNGLRLAEPRYAGALARAGLTFVKFSIHGHDAETHDKLVGVPGAFAKCLRAVENLRELKLGMGVNLVLNRWNHEHLSEFFDLFLGKLGLSNFVLIAPLHEGSMAAHTRDIGAPLSEMAPNIRKAFDQFRRLGHPKPPLLLNFAPCILPGFEREMLGWSNFNTIVVGPDGQASDLDQSAKSCAVKKAGCRRCVYNERCVGIDRSYAERFGTVEFRPLLQAPRPRGVAAWRKGRRDPAVLTDNEQCVLEVLRVENPVTTRRFLAIASRIALCRDCKDENAAIVAAETSARLGRVKRAFQRGRYVWSLARTISARK